jgi:hypothetical protein
LVIAEGSVRVMASKRWFCWHLICVVIISEESIYTGRDLGKVLYSRNRNRLPTLLNTHLYLTVVLGLIYLACCI